MISFAGIEIFPIPFISLTISTLVDSVGLGAEDLNDLATQRRLTSTEKKVKYRMEASERWKAERDKEALALAKKIEDDVYDMDSKSVQLSKKRNRAMSKNAIVDMHASAKKKPKLEVPVKAVDEEVAVESVLQEQNEVVFDFTKPAEEPKSEGEVKKAEKSEKTFSPKNTPTKDSKKDKRDGKSKKKHPKKKEKSK